MNLGKLSLHLVLALLQPGLQAAGLFGQGNEAPPFDLTAWGAEAMEAGDWFPKDPRTLWYGTGSGYPIRSFRIPSEIRDVGPAPVLNGTPDVSREGEHGIRLVIWTGFGGAGIDHFWVRAEVHPGQHTELLGAEFLPLANSFTVEGLREHRLSDQRIPYLAGPGADGIIRQQRPVYQTDYLRVRVRYRKSRSLGSWSAGEREIELGAWYQVPTAPAAAGTRVLAFDVSNPPVASSPMGGIFPAFVGTLRFDAAPTPGQPALADLDELLYDPVDVLSAPWIGTPPPELFNAHQDGLRLEASQTFTCPPSVPDCWRDRAVTVPFLARWRDGSVTSQVLEMKPQVDLGEDASD